MNIPKYNVSIISTRDIKVDLGVNVDALSGKLTYFTIDGLSLGDICHTVGCTGTAKPNANISTISFFIVLTSFY
jgi:hypothetical protein